MNESIQTPLQRALGSKWDELPLALQAHYQRDENSDVGTLDIEYPRFMQAYYSMMHLLGALINQRGRAIPTIVEKKIIGNIQYWKRAVKFPNGKTIIFKSTWVYAQNNEIIEYINPVLGLRMAVSIENEKLYFHGKHFVIKLGVLLIPIPEWLVLGHSSIVETAINEKEFKMDYRITHPWLGEIFRYAGRFTTLKNKY